MKLKEFNKTLNESSKFKIDKTSNQIDVEAFVFNENYKAPISYRKIAYSAMSVLIVFIFSFYLYLRLTPVSTLTIDINPSLEIELNRFNRVVHINGLDQESLDFIEELDVKNKTVDDLMDTIYSKGLENGYFTVSEAYALVGVYANDSTKETTIDALVNQYQNITFLTVTLHEDINVSSVEFNNGLGNYTPETNEGAYDDPNDSNSQPGIILDREDYTNLTDEAFNELLEELDISVTKLSIILDIYNYYPEYSIDDLSLLADMNISELIIMYNNIE
ncbi:hypothetical protein ACAG96_01520 [Candidatus Izemoplasma sp. B36]|uniref:anti-sigma-I factor RsgI family protein n=1 Tax=Candidatus Izemoplasma sp. B36 TaxID=3242468 RepID=UPI0035585E9B